MWRKAMLYLGLGPDEEYDDYDSSYDDGSGPERERVGAHSRSGRQSAGATAVSSYAEEPAAVGAVRPISGRDEGGQAPPVASSRPRPQVVRPVPATPSAKPHVVVPTSFNEAQELADKFRGNQPVIMNLQGAERDLSRRLIDFASGLCYGLGGQMEKVANQVYLLTPSNVEVSAEERRRLEERGYDG
jgi:cell division inhibitor SepF